MNHFVGSCYSTISAVMKTMLNVLAAADMRVLLPSVRTYACVL